MAQINGYEIIADKWSAKHTGGIVILGHTMRGGRREYVTALVKSLTDTEWWAGHYFNTFDYDKAGEALQAALADYLNR